MAHQLQIAHRVRPAQRLRVNVVYGQHMQRQLVPAPGAAPVLAGVQQLLVRPRVGGNRPGQVIPARRFPQNSRTPVLPRRLIGAVHRNLQLPFGARVQHLRGLRRLVNANPLPVQPFGSDAGGSAAAEGIQHQVAGVGRRVDDAFQQAYRLLRPPPRIFPRPAGNRANIRPLVGRRLPASTGQIAFERRHTARGRIMNKPRVIQSVQPRQHTGDTAVSGNCGPFNPFGIVAPQRYAPVPPAISRIVPAPGLPAFPVADALRRSVVQPVLPPLVLQPVVPIHIFTVQRHSDVGHVYPAAMAVKKDGVADIAETARIVVRRGALPADFRLALLPAEHSVHNAMQIIGRRRVAMQVNAARGLQHPVQLQ